MWFRIKTFFLVAIAAIVLAFLHYALPQRDIVQVSGTEIIRMDVGDGWFMARQDAGTNPNATRDVRLINAVDANGTVRVYRNEDTGWGWPPYFKFDSSDLQAEAQNHAKVDDWVAIRHYGWRFRLFSMYPNATSMKTVDGPDVSLIPWFNIVFLVILALTLWAVGVRIKRWKDRTIDPVFDGIGEALEDVSEEVEERKGAAGRWMDRLFGRTR